jgi:hypothetical protein
MGIDVCNFDVSKLKLIEQARNKQAGWKQMKSKRSMWSEVWGDWAGF